ncbi:MAG TPA: hypothetical protein VL749_09465 [Patescibacteria group bacterium]|jgi:hypothetical protein|nr:hypothetical protein [Patescibacteria group bacterium]
MLDDDTLKDLYSTRGVPTDWQELTPDTMAPAFRLWYRALPSPKSDFVEGSAYAEWLIHDPVAALRDSGLIPSAEEDAEEPHISTMVVNHEKTLNRLIMYAMVVVSTNPKTVGITIVKEGYPGD